MLRNFTTFLIFILLCNCKNNKLNREPVIIDSISFLKYGQEFDLNNIMTGVDFLNEIQNSSDRYRIPYIIDNKINQIEFSNNYNLKKKQKNKST